MTGDETSDVQISNGTLREIDGKPSIYYDGYWIRHYPPPEDTLEARRALIEGLTRRAFHHTEEGINTPGENLELARDAYAAETDPSRRRVNGAMLAGALFNRATDIFKAVVELAHKGVRISFDNELMKQCADCLQEAMELGKSVKHYSGHEGIDELWGEPLKAFTMPIEDFYTSRYIKIAQTMRDIDRITNRLVELFAPLDVFEGLEPLIRAFAAAAKLESETMKSDPVILEVWPQFVAAGERLLEFSVDADADTPEEVGRHYREGVGVIREGTNLITYLAGARVPMPKSTREFMLICDAFEHDGARLSASSPSRVGTPHAG